MTPAATLFGYSSGGAVLTLVLPLGLFIVVMIVLYFVFSRRRAVPAPRAIAGAKPVAPDPQTVGARREDIPANGEDTAVHDTVVGDSPAEDPE